MILELSPSCSHAQSRIFDNIIGNAVDGTEGIEFLLYIDRKWRLEMELYLYEHWIE